jgi:N-acetylmuramoyl-L-alanine amidase
MNGIVVHHSASDDGAGADFHNIVRWHTAGRGWSDIGYHAVVEVINGEVTCIYGRPTTRFGSHAMGYNDRLGICFVGNFSEAPPPSAMLDAAIKRVIVPWCRTFNLTAADISGHKDLPGASTECPGHLFDLDYFRHRVRRELET